MAQREGAEMQSPFKVLYITLELADPIFSGKY